MSTYYYYYLSLEESETQLEIDLMEAGPSNAPMKRNAPVFIKYSKKSVSILQSLKSRSKDQNPVSLSVPELEPEPEKRPESSSSLVSFPVPNLEPEPEKRLESSSSLAVANPVSLSVPNYIQQYKQNWKFGEDLPEQVRNIIFSKDVHKLLHVRSEILETLEEVDIDKEIADISPEFLNRLNEAVGTAFTVDESDPRMKVSLKEFQEINYESPRVPTGRIGLKDDYLFTWFLKPRIQGDGKRKSEKTVLQYATYLFGKSDENLYKYLESKNILCEDALFPSSVRITQEIEAWATTENPSTSSKFFFPKFNY